MWEEIKRKMEEISWVGINHYVDKAELEAFYDRVKVGDAVQLVLEPGNVWDEKAVAVYYNFLMAGYISRYETEAVHVLARHGHRLVGHVTDDVDRELNRIMISVESLDVMDVREDSYPVLERLDLGMEVVPFVMHEETSYELIWRGVMGWMDSVMMLNPGEDLAVATVGKIVDAVERYLTIWNCSLSREANMLPTRLLRRVQRLARMSDGFAEMLDGVIGELKRAVARQNRLERIVDVFVRQMGVCRERYEGRNGLFDRIRKSYAGRDDELRKLAERIEDWLGNLPERVGEGYVQGLDVFAHRIYASGLRSLDLYMVIAHLLVLELVKKMLYGEDVCGAGKGAGRNTFLFTSGANTNIYVGK